MHASCFRFPVSHWGWDSSRQQCRLTLLARRKERRVDIKGPGNQLRRGFTIAGTGQEAELMPPAGRDSGPQPRGRQRPGSSEQGKDFCRGASWLPSPKPTSLPSQPSTRPRASAGRSAAKSGPAATHHFYSLVPRGAGHFGASTSCGFQTRKAVRREQSHCLVPERTL